MDLDEDRLQILKTYKYALIHIGIDFSREDVQEALELCWDGLEDGFKATIEFWRTGKMQYPSAFLINALGNKWHPFNWQDIWLADPNFISPAHKWWQQAEINLGRETVNCLLTDIVEDGRGVEYIVLANGRSIALTTVKAWEWERVLNFAQNPRGIR